MNIRKLIAGAASALLVGGGLALATALPASAVPTPGPWATSFDASASCGVLTLTVNSNDDVGATWLYGLTASVGGDYVGEIVKTGPGVDAAEFFFEEDSYGGLATVTYSVHAATETGALPAGFEVGATHTIDVPTDCLPPVPPQPADDVQVDNVVLNSDTEICEDTIQRNERVVPYVYDAATNTWIAGTPGEWVAVGDPYTEATPDCEIVVDPPVVDPPVVDPPVVDPPVEEPVITAPVAETPVATTLAATGGGTGWVAAGAALAALTAGGALLLARRRQRV